MRRGRKLWLCCLGLALLGAGEGGAPAPAAPPLAPAELTLEQLLAQRGWTGAQLRENAVNQLEAKVVLNGQHELRFQISTSFSKTILDEDVAKELGLQIEPTNIEVTGAKKQRLGMVALESLAFPETSLGPVTLFTADLSSIMGKSSMVELPAGVIGSDLLTKYQAVLEIPTSKLYLRVR